MLKQNLTMATLAMALTLPAGSVLAQDAEAAIKARQGQFRIMALNLGVLGAIAKGEMEYDAATAQTAADNLVRISSVAQDFNWPEGSDNMSADGTRALPAIWDNLPDVISKWEDFGTAAAAMQTAAGDSPEAIGAALQEVGGACKACHDEYRESN